MTTLTGLTASHGYSTSPPTNNYSGTLWSAQRSMNAGAVKIKPTDYTWTIKDVDGDWYTETFEWLSVEFALYARKIGNVVPPSPLRIGSPVTIRKNWGVALGYITIATPSSSGLYSLYTRPVQVRKGGVTKTLNAGAAAGLTWGLKATFNLQYN